MKITLPWAAAVAFFSSLPDDPTPRGGCLHPDSEGRCAIECCGCGCATWDAAAEGWRTRTSETLVRALPGGIAEVHVPAESRHRRAVLSAMALVARDCPPADPAAWHSIRVAAEEARAVRAEAA